MNKYNVLKDCTIATDHKAGEVVELSVEDAQPHLDNGNIELALRVIAQADLDANPILVELGAAVGDSVAVTPAPAQ